MKRSALLMSGLLALLAACNQAVPAEHGLLTSQAMLSVTNTSDSGPGSLRQAIAASNATPGADTITFQSGVTGSIILTSGQLTITDALTIVGPGANQLAISGNNASGVFEIRAVTSDVTISGLTVTNGRGSYAGGGILVGTVGTFNLINAAVTNNTATDTGGGLEFGPKLNSPSTLNISGSTFSGNRSKEGGAIHLEGGTANITNTTISGNTATEAYGGGISNFESVITINHSTITGNSSSGTSVRGSGGGVANLNITNITVANTIIAGNSGVNPDVSDYKDARGNFVSLGGNLIGNNQGTTGAFTAGNSNANGDIVGTSAAPVDPKLAALADNGGPTQTIALLGGSPALDHAGSASCPATDQRGVPRPQGSGCDIGAFELGGRVVVDTTAPTITLTTPVNGAPYLLNQSVTAAYSCADETGGSGLASCTGTVTNGAGIDTASVGTKTFSVTATDNAGNTNTRLVSYTVGYAFSGFSSPVDAAPTLNVAKAGQSIPLKWRITDANGVPVSTLTGVSVTVASLNCSSGVTSDAVEEYAAGSSGLQNLGNGYYQFNWKSPKSYAGSCKTLLLNLGEGINRTSLFQFN